ncbi:MAG: hypothetical protein M1546_12795, partial [Chloroflexi bacterium]|nr:hypothetical protein [Chloroflexota bacterium]
MHIALGAYLLSGTPGYRQAGIHQYIRALLEALGRGGEGEQGSRGAEEREVHFTALISPTARGEVPTVNLQSPISNLSSPISLLPASRSTESPLQRIWVEQVETPGVLRRLGASVYHGMAFVAPLRAPCPT